MLQREPQVIDSETVSQSMDRKKCNMYSHTSANYGTTITYGSQIEKMGGWREGGTTGISSSQKNEGKY